MESDRNEDYIIWTGYDGLDEEEILAGISELENGNGKE